MTRMTWMIVAALAWATIGCGTESSDAPSEPAEPTAEEPTAEEPTAAEEEPVAEVQEEEPAEEVVEREDQSELECDSDEVDCPLYDWQAEHAEPAVVDRDLEALAAVLHQIEFYAPDPSWNEGENGWAMIARRGALAAEAGEFDEARVACRQCHREYPSEDMPFRKMYETQGYRTQALPELPENAAETGLPDLEMPAAEG